ncbi:MAG: hypothetical protein CSA66_04950 [Proteobacteria bacterium]|nr:MAG: hypothetical protein CSA66_04950 [Pseudomonadota bacterium]
MIRTLSNVIGVDDCPFPRGHRGDVAVVGAVFASDRLDGVLTTKIRRDGANATDRLAAMILGSRFDDHIQAVLLQGIALGGFNVVDVHRLSATLGRPVLVVARRAPRMGAIERALLGPVPGGARKWRLIERAGPMEPLAGVWVQRAGLELAEAEALLAAHIRHGSLPEPLRVAHILAGGFATGASRGRA